MQLRQKIMLLAITPLILALVAIALAVRHQATSLANQQRASVEAAYLASKEAALSHYVTLAVHSIAPLYNSGRNDEATRTKAKAILAQLEYGDDGYFYVYDLHGTNLMHPRQPDLVGRNLWDLRDANGSPTIQRLIAKAESGGGLVRYLWEKPSTGKVAPKLGYVVMLDRWGWMLGTGIYLDDVDAALAKIDAQSASNIHSTMLWIAAIAIAGSLVIALSGLALNISEHRVADAKLKVLTQRVVRSQEDERARLSRDLHDGISQALVSIKLQIEAGMARLAGGAPKPDCMQSLDRATLQLNNVLGEVRRISHNLRPALLDDLGLAAALEHLLHEFSELTGVDATFEARGRTDGLSEVENTVLFRIAQESLTNIERHARARRVTLRLHGSKSHVQMIISDDGHGFDVEHVSSHPKAGIGLRNMHERMEAVRGTLQLISSLAAGTQVIATLQRV